MTQLDCARTGVLLERRAAGLTAAERLRLERHLEDCAACARDAALLDDAVELLSQGESLSDAVRARILTTALSAEQEVPVETRAPRTWRAFAVAAVALLAIAGWALRPRAPGAVAPLSLGAPGARALFARAALPAARELGVVSGRARRVGGALSAETRATVRAGHARAELDPGSVVRWHAERTTLELDSGRVRVDVDPAAGRAFAVDTPDFRVEVLGTSFEVSLDGVVVTRGRVRVRAGKSEHTLGPGERWTRGREPEAAQAQPPPAQPDVAALLASARRQLAAGRPGAAKATIGRALGAQPSPPQAAEAHSLLAECALVNGDRGEAQRRYAEVARQHAGTAAGETALFAAARLEKDPKRARALLEDYLRRHPNGRFSSEARTRLRALLGP